MPQISVFRGIIILMFSNEGHHRVGHFHAQYAEHKASLSFDGEVIVGSLPNPQLKLVRQWAALRRVELEANWEKARSGQRVEEIDPLP